MIWEAVLALARRDGVSRINQLAGCWERTIDDQWWIALNGHRRAVKCSRGAEVPPYTMYVEFNGWPAGFVGIDSGVLAAGSAANEDSFLAALRKAAGEGAS